MNFTQIPAYVGPIGGPEIVLLLGLLFLVLPIILVIIFITKKSKAAKPDKTEASLKNLVNLRQQNLITEEEYQAKRSSVLSQI